MIDGWVRTGAGLIVPESVVRHTKRPTCIDLFCGCGGFSLGFMQAGFEVVAGVDNDFDAMVTYLCNLGSYPVHIEFIEEEDEWQVEKRLRKLMGLDKAKGNSIRVPCFLPGTGWIRHNPDVPPVRHFFFGDIRKLTGERLLKVVGKEPGEVDCVVGGPPCQGFSRIGKRDIMDPRNSLVFDFARLVCEMRPKTFVMENVPAIQSMVTPEGVPVVDALARIFEDGGFGTWEAIKRSLLMTSGAGAVLRGKPIVDGTTEGMSRKRTRKYEDDEQEQGQLALFESHVASGEE